MGVKVKYKAKKTLCCRTGCKTKALPGQRICHKHKNQAQREYNQRKREQFKNLSTENKRLLAQLTERIQDLNEMPIDEFRAKLERAKALTTESNNCFTEGI